LGYPLGISLRPISEANPLLLLPIPCHGPLTFIGYSIFLEEGLEPNLHLKEERGVQAQRGGDILRPLSKLEPVVSNPRRVVIRLHVRRLQRNLQRLKDELVHPSNIQAGISRVHYPCRQEIQKL